MYGVAYTLINPTPGNHTLRVNTDSSTQCCDIKICSFSGVNTVTPLGTIVEEESTGTTTGSSLAFTLNTGGLAVAYLIAQNPFTNFAQGADQTEQQTSVVGCATGDCFGVTTTATVSPMNYTWNSTGTDFWHVVLPINAALARPSAPIIFQ